MIWKQLNSLYILKSSGRNKQITATLKHKVNHILNKSGNITNTI